MRCWCTNVHKGAIELWCSNRVNEFSMWLKPTKCAVLRLAKRRRNSECMGFSICFNVCCMPACLGAAGFATRELLQRAMNHRALHTSLRGEPTKFARFSYPNSEPPMAIFEILRAMDLRYPTQKPDLHRLLLAHNRRMRVDFTMGNKVWDAPPPPNTAPLGSISELIGTLDPRYLMQKTASQSVTSTSR